MNFWAAMYAFYLFSLLSFILANTLCFPLFLFPFACLHCVSFDIALPEANVSYT